MCKGQAVCKKCAVSITRLYNRAWCDRGGFHSAVCKSPRVCELATQPAPRVQLYNFHAVRVLQYVAFISECG